VIDVARLPPSNRVVFGATVELEDQDEGSHITYQIVGEDEADIRRGLISVGSPIARALVGKSKGDLIEVDVPAGRRNYEIIAIRFV
jgi:transcription elongation factor GreA